MQRVPRARIRFARGRGFCALLVLAGAACIAEPPARAQSAAAAAKELTVRAHLQRAEFERAPY